MPSPSPSIWHDHDIEKLDHDDAERGGRCLTSQWCINCGETFCNAILNGLTHRDSVEPYRSQLQASAFRDTIFKQRAAQRANQRHFREEISRADTKASILLASAGVAAAVLAGAVAAGNITLSNALGAVQLLAVVAAVELGAGLTLLGAAVMPQLGKPTRGRARYFMEHAQYERLEDLREALDREERDPGGRHLAQLSTLSRIVKRKHRLTQAGELSGGAGVVLAIIAATLHQLL